MTKNPIILGTAKLGLEGRESAFAMLDAYVELGGTAIDTASVYSDWVPGEAGRSENTIGAWMAERRNRDALFLTTKGAHPPLSDAHSPRSDPASIRHDVELSLKRLGTDHLDRWYFHRDDPSRPIADMVGEIHKLIDEGKVGSYGVSNWQTPRIAEALALSGSRLAANQPLGNVLCAVMGPPSDDTLAILDAAMLRQAIEGGLQLDLFTSQCSGFFEHRKAGKPAPGDYKSPASAEAAAKIEAIATREGIDVSHLILAFLIGLGPNVRPVIGPRNAEQFRGTYGAGDLELSPAVMQDVATAAQMTTLLPR